MKILQKSYVSVIIYSDVDNGIYHPSVDVSPKGLSSFIRIW